jgi:CRP-like cAMP-binding protein
VPNHLLEKLSSKELDVLRPALHEIDLPMKKVLYEPEATIHYVYFPTSGVISMVNEPEPGEIVEFATIGREGMAGFPVLLGASSLPSRTLVQIPGAGLQMKTEDFGRVLEHVPRLNGMLLRYTMALLNQISQSTSCNRLHEVQERCARWLLQSHDRVDGDSFPLTHEFLAQMLGVHRPTVSIAAGMLQQAGLIEYKRGVITILNRQGLEAASCTCYRLITAEYERLLNEPR